MNSQKCYDRPKSNALMQIIWSNIKALKFSMVCSDGDWIIAIQESNDRCSCCSVFKRALSTPHLWFEFSIISHQFSSKVLKLTTHKTKKWFYEQNMRRLSIKEAIRNAWKEMRIMTNCNCGVLFCAQARVSLVLFDFFVVSHRRKLSLPFVL